MAQFQYDPTKEATILRQVLALIESIRYKRYDRWYEQRHPLGQKFTQLELTQQALPTYGNLLAGRSKRLPTRQQLLGVASYLECTIAETNDLLGCAEYIPEYEPLNDIQYRQAILRAKRFMAFIGLPAGVMGRGGDGIVANQAFQKLNHLLPFESLSSEQRNIIHTSFDPSLPSHTLYRSTPSTWSATAQGCIDLVKSTSRCFQHESWFQDRLDTWHQLPEFTQYWNATSSHRDLVDGGVQVKMFTPLLDQPISEESVIIPFSREFEVCLIVWQPADEAARHVYEMLGCRYDSMRWDEMFDDLTQFQNDD